MNDSEAIVAIVLLLCCIVIFSNPLISNERKQNENEELICIEYKTITRKRLFSIVPTYETYNECIDWEWKVKGEDKE